MRIVDRKTFLALPAGVMYAKIPEQWIFGELCFKDDTLGNDWRYLPPTDIKSRDTNEWQGRLEAMLLTGGSFPMEDATTRDGLYDESDHFLVFERTDLLAFRKLLDRAIAETSE